MPYGPNVRFPVKYFGTFTITGTDIKADGWSNKFIPIGNSQIFSAETALLGKLFHEYKITYAKIKITFTQYKFQQWSWKTHPYQVAMTVVSFIRDQESPYKSVGKVTFDGICSEPGCRVSHLPPGGVAVTHHTWRPTEPQDRDWRLTSNDGLLNLYVGWRLDDLITDTFIGCSAMVEITTEIQLRGYDLGAASVCLTNKYHVEQDISSTSSISEFEAVDAPGPNQSPSEESSYISLSNLTIRDDVAETCQQADDALSSVTISRKKRP